MVKNSKIMSTLVSPHIRALVDKANDMKISKQDIVTILDRGEELVLIYYKG